MLDWNTIDTVLLDMDGTLLDLHYDDYFWQQHLPRRYAEVNQISEQQAQQALYADYQQNLGKLTWYCLDHWREHTGLDIMQLKREVQEKIAWREHAEAFLVALKQAGKQRVLVTNCHPDGLALKLERTNLGEHLDAIYSTHQFQLPKEELELWHQLQRHHHFEPARSLFIDDNQALLDVAAQFGIAHRVAILNPDSKRPALPADTASRHIGIDDYRELMVGLYQSG
ncbi:GMP/IMP nucleotidase [Aliagarivorans taiwanensis]|uniref:GMP/IMP nucleotidase n=1 Tax=Aliagarivorans taiwanensis TaxID=561966 RepID=UPI00040C489B|nr:GMP/IMP nucleotidase [Aliagarivorans taiwanensis]